jgi:hypothetical protein
LQNHKTLNVNRSLEEQRLEYSQRRFLAMPLAGTLAWAIVGMAGIFMKPFPATITLFCATGSIAYLGIWFSRFTGENFMDKTKPKNTFDTLFLLTVLMALLVYAIAIPFFLEDYTSLPLSVGILTGLMWAPLSWVIQHWIGIVHSVVRTLLVLAAWFIFPTHRLVAVPIVIVIVYLFTIYILESRWRALKNAPLL